ncbi:MAG: glycosyltransferase [Candidatus Koribacter versatilis]|uniref:Glycosyltransferase n=1 Tax=Candidatus Korobacter versatilis TaxID=658062 RepID=A0A932A6Z2_9BACT|nr:glycosyltransferase [Candidatus Koribacter versatilis]
MIWFCWIYGGVIGAAMLTIVTIAARGLRTIPDLTKPEWDIQPQGKPRLSVIVPALNEQEAIGACLGSLLEQDYDNLEVIAVNDRSTDSTGDIMEKIRVARRPSAAAFDLKVIHITELPPGWLGKPHAMWKAAAVATGEWLLFTDADVMFRSDSLRRAVAYAESEHADHLVLAPTMLALTVGERMITAMIQMAMIALRPWKVRDPKSRAFLGWGAFNMVRRRAYEGIGAMEPLRLQVVEDMELGRRIKRAGFASRFATGPQLVQIRWGRGALGPVRNLTKNAYAGLGFRWWLALALVLATLAFHVVPFFAIWFAPGWTKLGFAIELAGLFWIYFRLRKLYNINPAYFFLNPVAGSLMAYAMLRSLVVTVRQGGIIWRGTKYSTEELRRASPKPWD